MDTGMLKIENVKKAYKLKNKEKVLAINGITLDIEKGKCTCIVGESGCGKSTLAKLIVGIEECTSGTIHFKGKNIKNIKRKDPLKKDLQMVFQDSFSSVNKRRNILQIIEEPLINFSSISKKDRLKRVLELLNSVGLDANDISKFPNQFSGGQLQRICIARAIANNPNLLVLDEPLSSLDVSVQGQILNLLSDLKSQYNLTYIFISHDLEAVYYLADSIIIMYKGKILEQIDDINHFYSMKHPYTQKLLNASINFNSKINNNIEKVNENETTMGCVYFNRCESCTSICRTSEPSLVTISTGHKIACHNIIKK